MARLCRSAAWLTVVLTLFVMPPRVAAQAELLTLDQLVAGASEIVVAKVLNRAAEWEYYGASRLIISKVTIEVEQSLKGSPGRRVVLEVMGGTIGDETQRVSHVPELRVGDHDVLFLTGRSNAASPLVGSDQGRFRIMTESATGVARVLTPGFAPLQAASHIGTARTPALAPMSSALALSDFVTLIRDRVPSTGAPAMRRPLGVGLFALILILGLGAGNSRAYWYYGPKWPSSPVMALQLGPITNGVTLIDGSTTWGQPAEAALATWNQVVDTIQFRVTRDSTAPTGLGNSVNNVFWSNNIYGRSFDVYAGWTTWRTVGNTVVEADVILNNQRSWNSYRGNIRSGIVDIRRLLMHEFGHAIGFDHPDEHGQFVPAVMNASLSNVDTLTADDISAAQYHYSFGNGSVSFPPRNESLDFRNHLETRYRDVLRRGTTTTFVDREGDIVWISEYYRYRANGCSHAQAQTRVFSQIDGAGTYGVCGASPTGAIAFPPRNEALDFRLALEAKYRDGLRRGPSQSSVDNEGDVVWIQEYLRYRVNSCGHGVAVDKVFAQLDGRGVQPTC